MTSKLTFHAQASKSETIVNTRVSAEDVDDAPTFADNAAAFDTRWAARTAARVDWDGISPWTINVDYDSPECKTIEQELVNRPGWNSGQDQVWFWEDFDGRSDRTANRSRYGESWDTDAPNAPKLVVTYTPPSSGGSPASQLISAGLI